MKARLSIFICILCICIGYSDKEEGNGVAYRPDGFPEILAPLEGAAEIRYLNPETGDLLLGRRLWAASIASWMREINKEGLIVHCSGIQV